MAKVQDLFWSDTTVKIATFTSRKTLIGCLIFICRWTYCSSVLIMIVKFHINPKSQIFLIDRLSLIKLMCNIRALNSTGGLLKNKSHKTLFSNAELYTNVNCSCLLIVPSYSYKVTQKAYLGCMVRFLLSWIRGTPSQVLPIIISFQAEVLNKRYLSN